MKITATILSILLRPVVLDAILYSCIGMFTFMQGYLSTEEAYKYCSPFVLFWTKFCIGSLGAATAALKMFRSTTYAEHLQSKLTPTPTLTPTQPQAPQQTPTQQ